MLMTIHITIVKHTPMKIILDVFVSNTGDVFESVVGEVEVNVSFENVVGEVEVDVSFESVVGYVKFVKV